MKKKKKEHLMRRGLFKMGIIQNEEQDREKLRHFYGYPILNQFY